MTRMSVSIILVGALAFAGGCGSKKKEETLAKVTQGGAKRGGPGELRPKGDPGAGSAETAVASRGAGDGEFSPIYFDYDTAELSAEARDTLAALADHLLANPGAKVTIAGNADERGSPEYNVALGQERSEAAKKYLVRLGVDASRVKAISYGEERPAADGEGETAWAKNRRAEFELR